MSEALLQASNLRLSLRQRGGALRIVNGIDFEIGQGEFFALIGESGSGKSMIARAIMRLQPPRRLQVEGELRLAGIDLANAKESQMRRLRGGAIGMIFQEPMSALNPVMTIRRQLEEAMRIHATVPKAARAALWRERLVEMGLADPDRIGSLYPHQLSGGMRQRVMIAMALLNGPALLVADEPTTALDVMIQKSIMTIFDRLRQGGLAIFFISHDLALVNNHADRIGVLYGGVMMEDGPAQTVIERPAHPYTAALLACLPRARAPGTRQTGIEGGVPRVDDWFPGCRFAPRCPRRQADCTLGDIPFVQSEPGRRVRCLYPLT